MIPQPPSTAAPVRNKGGFFRALHFYRKMDDLADEQEDFTGPVPHPSSVAASAPSADGPTDIGKGPSAQGSPGEAFLEKLQLEFIERLWVAIKKHCMLGVAGGRNAGAHETISLQDFLRLARQLLKNHTADDDRYLGLLFQRVDRRKRGSVRTTDIATALVLICKDGAIPKLKTIFRIFDADDDSCLTHDQIFDMYLSIKVNNVTRTREELVIDATFDNELSLQDAKRLYELTVEHLRVVSDFVIFEEFKTVFEESIVGKFLLEKLLPGVFSLDWILNNSYEPPNLENNQFGGDVKRGLVEALRRGEEHLKLSKKDGRGSRIMESWLGPTSHRLHTDDQNEPTLATDKAPQRQNQRGAGGSTALPRIPTGNLRGNARGSRCAAAVAGGGAGAPQTGRGVGGKDMSPRVAGTKDVTTGGGHSGPGGGASGAVADDEENSEDESDEDDYDRSAHGRHGRHGHRGVGNVLSDKAGGYSMQEALDIPKIPPSTLNHTHAKLFRSTMLDEKTQQAYLRDKKDVNRNMKYQCLVCAMDHVFSVKKISASAEHRHVH